jgi:hypothetical protein
MNEMHETLPDNGERKWKAVYTIVEPRPGQPRDKKHWVRVGTAFTNRDQSMNVVLDAMPTNGTLHIREYVPYEERGRRDESAGFAAAKGAF